MPDKKIIAVIGATGAQGGGLVRAILADELPDGRVLLGELHLLRPGAPETSWLRANASRIPLGWKVSSS